MLLVSLPDNFLKPLLIGKKANISTFFLFLGILGGLQVYGFLGILFGPLVVTLLTAFIQIYREEFARSLQSKTPGLSNGPTCRCSRNSRRIHLSYRLLLNGGEY